MPSMTFSLGIAVLVGITLVWGSTFVVIKDALDTVSVPLLLALRFSMAALLLVWVRFDRAALRPSLILGLLAFTGFATQTIGLSTTSASKAAFITGLSVILTPLLGAVWLRTKIPQRAYIAACLAVGGLGLMTLTSVQGVNIGDVWVIATAFAYALYILYLGTVANRYAALTLGMMQLWPMALLAWGWALPDVSQITQLPLSTYGAIFYLALMATALVNVFQTYAQRVVPAHVAALVFVLEPLFAALFAYLLLGERLGPLGWLGGALIVVAMLVGELRPKRWRLGFRQGAGD